MTTLTISGMTCSHCVASVTRALREVAGVEEAEVGLEAGTAAVAGEGADPKELARAVEELGYKVTAIEVRSVERKQGKEGKDEDQGHTH